MATAGSWNRVRHSLRRRAQILACQLATEKHPSYEFGKGVSVLLSPGLLANCRINLECPVKGEPSGSGMYWFDPKDFLEGREEGTPKR